MAQPFAGAGGARRILDWSRANLAVPSQIVGDRLIFFGDAGTQTGLDIFTVPMAGGAPTPLVKGPLTDAEPQVSPDGRWIAYATTETGGFEAFVQPYPSGGAKWQGSTSGGPPPRGRRGGRAPVLPTEHREP